MNNFHNSNNFFSKICEYLKLLEELHVITRLDFLKKNYENFINEIK